ncbi:MAG: aldehyde dehydrogenase family protein [Armatimonadota bacterium]|nr:aldehyde dehydrogenase family protein [Armatimonadota bacterium]MDR7452309.1 aldehyde dehydrogenase family protein [Armatimonadota bacterium]MDR7467800.1 aldehyde dehydrogenase family protein [Armatimonadota bacterium]MDR7494614.1 aldehyde dehydrogenase family protein [Armatimonadota bacterium]MDR7499674.1 aldehyde dehydrogenase family protein [Armatimonadota bacterium]
MAVQQVDRKLYIGGRWTGGGEVIPVRNKYSGEIIGTIPSATRDDVDAAVAAALRAAPLMAEMPAHRRAAILQAAAAGIRARREEFARTIAAEAGKALKYARIEVDRGISTFTFAAEEAKRLHGETVPLDAAAAGEGYFGFFVRRPVGVVAAITPFNFPLNLVAHKVAPALAAGNSVVLKPASWTPLTAVLLVETLIEAGLPPGAINLVAGPGGTVGEWLVTDPRVAKVTFTGSADVGRQIVSRAGIKKITLELGNTSPVIVAPDADLEFVARRCAVGAYYNSGQVCLSVQRILSDRTVYDPFLDRFTRAAEAMVVGDPLDERVDVGPMIDEGEAVRIEGWVAEAVNGGARVATGGRREGPVYWPTVLTDVRPEMTVVAREAFAPVASVMPYDDFEEALHLADATEYGLQAAVFTRSLDRLFQAMRRLNFGGIIVNDAPTFRVDHMPYGGNRQSGIGREGVRYAMEEMTNIQIIAIRQG